MAKEKQKEDKEEPKKPRYVVIRNFHDIKDINIRHKEGDDVSHFEPSRLEWLISVDHVKKIEG